MGTPPGLGPIVTTHGSLNDDETRQKTSNTRNGCLTLGSYDTHDPTYFTKTNHVLLKSSRFLGYDETRIGIRIRIGKSIFSWETTMNTNTNTNTNTNNINTYPKQQQQHHRQQHLQHHPQDHQWHPYPSHSRALAGSP